MYEEMVTARHYEERLQEEYLEGKQPAFDISAGPIPGELHLAAGHEASGAGVCQHLRDDDTVTAPHRPHHIAIAKGVDLKRMTAEIFGRETGLSKGKGGHMHLFDPDVNFACSGIIAEGCPPAVGAGLAAKKRNTDSVAVAFLGEGAIDQGRVPRVAEPGERSKPPRRLRNRGQRLGHQHAERARHRRRERCTARWRVRPPWRSRRRRRRRRDLRGRREAIGRARDGNGPTLLEVQVHRRMGHFMGDAEGTVPTRTRRRPSSGTRSSDWRASFGPTTCPTRRSTTSARAPASASRRRSSGRKDQPEPEPDAAYEDVFVNPPSGATESEPPAAETGGDD